MILIGLMSVALFSLLVFVQKGAIEESRIAFEIKSWNEAYGHRRCDYIRAYQMAANYFSANQSAAEVDFGGPGAYGKWFNTRRQR